MRVILQYCLGDPLPVCVVTSCPVCCVGNAVSFEGCVWGVGDSSVGVNGGVGSWVVWRGNAGGSTLLSPVMFSWFWLMKWYLSSTVSELRQSKVMSRPFNVTPTELALLRVSSWPSFHHWQWSVWCLFPMRQGTSTGPLLGQGKEYNAPAIEREGGLFALIWNHLNLISHDFSPTGLISPIIYTII